MMYRYNWIAFALAVLLFSCGSKKDEVDPEKDDKKEAVDSATKGSFAFPEIDSQPRFYSGIIKVAFSAQNLTDIKVKIDGKEVANFPESGTHEYEFDTRKLEDGEVEFIYTGKQEDGEEVSIKKTLPIKNHLITINLKGSGRYGQGDEFSPILTDIIQIHNNEGEILETISLEDKADEKIEIERPLGLGDTDYYVSKITILEQQKFEMYSYNFRDEEEFMIDNLSYDQYQDIDERVENTTKVMFQNKPEGALVILYKVANEDTRTFNSYYLSNVTTGSNFEHDLDYYSDGDFDPSSGTVKFLFTLKTNEHLIIKELETKIDQPIDLSTILDKDGMKKQTVQRPAIVTSGGASLYFPYTWYDFQYSVNLSFNNSNEINFYGVEDLLTGFDFNVLLSYQKGLDSYRFNSYRSFERVTLEQLIDYNKDTNEVNVIATTELSSVDFIVRKNGNNLSDFKYQYVTSYYLPKGKFRPKTLPISKEVKERYELTTIEDVAPHAIEVYGFIAKDKQDNVVSTKKYKELTFYNPENFGLFFNSYQTHAKIYTDQ